MKLITLTALALLSFNALAADLETTIRDIEIEKNAKCTKTGTSWGINLGGPYGSTFYTVKFRCESNSGDFGLKVRMRDSHVRKVIYTKSF